MKINISNLPEGEKHYELTGSPIELGLEQGFFDTVVTRVALEKTSRQLFLTAEIESKARFRCDRCLEDFETKIGSSFRSVYVWDDAASPNDGDEEVHRLPHDVNVIDLSEDIKEYLQLAVPLKILCKEDCAGLCSSCGKNLNTILSGACNCGAGEVDPRWNKLGDFLGKLNRN
jgi:uncharacterized protein